MTYEHSCLIGLQEFFVLLPLFSFKYAPLANARSFKRVHLFVVLYFVLYCGSGQMLDLFIIITYYYYNKRTGGIMRERENVRDNYIFF